MVAPRIARKPAVAEAIAELCRRAMGAPVERPGYQVVIHECAKCETASRDAFSGEVAIAPDELAAAKVDAEIVDLRAGGTGEVRKSIKPSERRAVIARDRGRCGMCGTRAWLHIHHVRRDHRGVEDLRLLCSACHKTLVHGGYLSGVG